MFKTEYNRKYKGHMPKKEVVIMPRRDGTGPLGRGSMSGRGLGFCTGTNIAKCGMGLRLGLRLESGGSRGYGRNFFEERTESKTQEDVLIEQKEILQNRLESIKNKLDTLSNSGE